MKGSVEKILRHRKIFHSQQGEDGILAFILSKIPDKTSWCLEFGAWDGRSESNTYYFISSLKYQGIMIEADPTKYKCLCKNMMPFGTICINKFVRPDGENRLDNILIHTPIPENFDLLSIDIDGDDYHVWQSLNNYHPKIVIIEINMGDRPGVRRINQSFLPLAGSNNIGTDASSMLGKYDSIGSSITSITELATKKGYSLIANVHSNAIYVKREYLRLFHEREVSPEEVFTYEKQTLRDLSFKEMKNLGWKVLAKKVLKF